MPDCSTRFRVRWTGSDAAARVVVPCVVEGRFFGFFGLAADANATHRHTVARTVQTRLMPVLYPVFLCRARLRPSRFRQDARLARRLALHYNVRRDEGARDLAKKTPLAEKLDSIRERI